MALLDFMKNRNASPQQAVAQKAQAQKPETAKEMFTRQAEQDRTAQQPIDRMPTDQQAKVDAIKQRLESATRHISPEQSKEPVPVDNSGSREAMRQNMTGQEKAAPALSPTTAQAGKTAEKGGPAPSDERGAKSPEKPSARPQQTLPRRPPSWER
jgi:hypothetical protein